MHKNTKSFGSVTLLQVFFCCLLVAMRFRLRFYGSRGFDQGTTAAADARGLGFGGVGDLLTIFKVTLGGWFAFNKWPGPFGFDFGFVSLVGLRKTYERTVLAASPHDSISYE